MSIAPVRARVREDPYELFGVLCGTVVARALVGMCRRPCWRATSVDSDGKCHWLGVSFLFPLRGTLASLFWKGLVV